MSESAIKELQATVAALRAELDTVKAQIKDIHRAVKISDVNGRKRIWLQCHSIAIRRDNAEQPDAIFLGTEDNRGFISFYYPAEEKGDIAMSLCVNPEGQPSIRLDGQDDKPRVLLTIEKDHGFGGFFAPDYKPGAVIRAVPGGGSFAVLQPDGKARGIFMHSDGRAKSGGQPATELLFATPDTKTMLALNANDGGSMIALSQPGTPNCATLVARDDCGSLLVRSAGDTTTAVVVASPDLARVMLYTGEDSRTINEAALTSHPTGASLTLNRPDGTCGVEAQASTDLSIIRLMDKVGNDAVELCHSGGLNALNVFTPAAAKAKAIRIGATSDIAQFSVHSPQNQDLHAWFGAAAGEVKCLIFDNKRPLVCLSHGETGGQVTAYGSAENPGFAALCGQTASASVTISTADGTTLAGMGANDYGGQLTLNNDLGFPRLFMGTHEESSVITLNYTGQKGLALAAGPTGGFVTAHDSAGNLRASLPAADDIEEND